jgi:hypothetical protein
MPRYNGTGPWGQGPGSGWGLGPCGAGRRRGFGGGVGRGFGSGYGRGSGGMGLWGRPWRGWRAYDYGPFGAGGPGYGAAPEDEAQALRDEQAYLQGELEAVQKRLAELETS